MDRRSWPWKKKTSEKTVAVMNSVGAPLASPNQGTQDDLKTVSYVQISPETYAHLIEKEDQVKGLNDELKGLNDELKGLNEKLSAAQSDITTKESLVKQHAKVAEEAVSGWEKAEAEALTLKTQLEAVTLLKLTAEDRASHLDGALKECMKQIRNVKEENEQKLTDVVFAKTKQWEKIKFELENRIDDFEQELIRASAENAALSRSLQERSNMLMKITEEKSEADAEIEVLKTNIQSCEREISSLKYEHNVVSKELEIRNEERNMSVRSAEVANKQHLEDVKKMTKLEAECQRLRGLVRKKLPGPAALAQMKLEVESLGRDHGETRLRRSPSKSASPRYGAVPDFTLENSHHYHRESEFLTTRLLTMEEETKMLKEALAKRNSELQASRNLCAKTLDKLHCIETQMIVSNQQKSPNKFNHEIPIEGSLSQNESNPPSLTSQSEDGIDEEGSCTESWATALISELSHFKKDKNSNKSSKEGNSNHLELMDDFLEMEKLACIPTESSGTITLSNGTMDKSKIENTDAKSSVGVPKDGNWQEEHHPVVDQPLKLVSSNQGQFSRMLASDSNELPLSKLQSRIASVLDSQTKDIDMRQLLENIKRIVQEMHQELPVEESFSVNASGDQKRPLEDMGGTTDSGISLAHHNVPCTDTKPATDPDLINAISQIHDFVVSLGKDAIDSQGRAFSDHEIGQKVQDFSDSVSKALSNEISVAGFILSLLHVLSETKELCFRLTGDNGNEEENNTSDCIDKVTLLVNNVIQHEPTKERFSSECIDVPPASDPEMLQQERPGIGGFELKDSLCKYSVEEFEQMKLEKEKLAIDLARCSESLEQAKYQLLETEKQLAEFKSLLASSQKSNSLAETQLKCMAESYNSLESRAQELENEISLLRSKAEMLDNDLQEERRSHEDDIANCKDLQEQIERNKQCATCSLPPDAETDNMTKQENEIATAAEKLAECQETIFLLSRQLKSMRPPAEVPESSPNERHRLSDHLSDEGLTSSGPEPRGGHNTQYSGHAELETIASAIQRTGGESPGDGYNPHYSPSDTEAGPIPRSPISAIKPRHRSSGSSFSRFFSKGRSEHKE